MFRSKLLCSSLLLGLSGPIVAQTLPFARTVIVPSGGTASANGANLLTALSGITTASASNPWLLKLDPGVYDLGTNQLVPKSFVDVEGAGRGTTFITSAVQGNGAPGATILVQSGVQSEMRELTIKNTSLGMGRGISINSSSFTLARVNVDVNTVDQSVAVEIINCSPVLKDMTVTIKTGRWGATGVALWGSSATLKNMTVQIASSNSDVTGVSIGGNSPTLDRLVVTIQSALTAFGVVAQGGSPLISNCEVSVSGGTSLNTGLFAKNVGSPHFRNCFVNVQGPEARGVDNQSPAMLEIRSSTLRATSSGRAWGVFNEGGTVTVVNSEVHGVGTTSGVGSFNINGTSVTQFDQSTLGGNFYSASNFSSGDQFYAGSSRLIGTVQSTGVGGYTCTSSYNASYVALGSTCQ